MNWALINSIVMSITVGKYDENNNFYWDTWDAEPGTIFSLIVYDGVSEYEPPINFLLRQVADDKQIGDFVGL